MLSTAIAVAAIAAGIAVLTGPNYEAKTTIRLETPTALSTRPVEPDAIEYADRLENTYAELLESRQSRVELKQRLGLSRVPIVRVDARPNTELFDVVGRAETPWGAVALSEAGSALLLEQISELGQAGIRTSDALFEARIAELEAQLAADRQRRRALLGKKAPALITERRLLLSSIRADEAALLELRGQYERERLARGGRVDTLTIVAPARLPEGQAGPSLAVLIGAGLLVGLIAGLCLAFLLNNLRPRRYSPFDAVVSRQTPSHPAR